MSMPSVSVPIQCAQLASERAAAQLHREQKRGIASLATIAGIAAFVGIFGTVLGIVNSFTGGGGERSTVLAALNLSLSEALVPFCLGLLVALQAAATHTYLSTQLHALHLDMHAASLALSNTLARH